MRTIMLGLALAGALSVGTSGAQARSLSDNQPIAQPVYWDGDYCGPRCQEHRAWRHERWESRRAWRHHRWEERRYGYYNYPRYGYNGYPRY
jgi:hypothetical protein